MKATAYILLIIGVLGAIASIINFYNGDSLTSALTTFICSTALIYGHFEVKKLSKN